MAGGGVILWQMRPDVFHTPETPPAEVRLILALAVALALHLALIFGVQVRPTARPESRAKSLQVNLAGHGVAANQQEVRSTVATQKPDRTATRLQADSPLPDVSLSKPAALPAPPAQAMLPPRSPLPALDIPLAEDPTYYSAKQVDVHPASSEPIRPEFPDSAAQTGVQGFVTLRLLIDDAGGVREITVVEAQPPDTFETAALKAFRNARFSPALRNGRPVKSDVRIKVTFELVNNPP